MPCPFQLPEAAALQGSLPSSSISHASSSAQAHVALSDLFCLPLALLRTLDLFRQSSIRHPFEVQLPNNLSFIYNTNSSLLGNITCSDVLGIRIQTFWRDSHSACCVRDNGDSNCSNYIPCPHWIDRKRVEEEEILN